MKELKYIITPFACIAIIISFQTFAQQASTPLQGTNNHQSNNKNKLVDACAKTYSGSSNQAEDCLICAKNPSDINSRRFINCMNSYETINERKNGQTGLDDLIGNTPNCIKGVKSFGC